MWLQVRTFATPDRYSQTNFSLEVAVKSMELYQDLFNVSYPLPKQGIGWSYTYSCCTFDSRTFST